MELKRFNCRDLLGSISKEGSTVRSSSVLFVGNQCRIHTGNAEEDVIEKDAVGGIIGKVSTVTHYSTESGETGATFAKRMERQALEAGVEIIY